MIPFLSSLLLTASIPYVELEIPITEDTYTEGIFFDETHGENPLLLIGYGYTQRDGMTKSYVKYNLENNSELKSEEILEAKLMLYQFRSFSPETYQVFVIEPNMPWKEDSLTAMQEMLVAGPNPIIQDLDKTQGWKEIDITQIFKKHLFFPETNNGIAIFTHNPLEAASSFWSKDCSINIPPVGCEPGLLPHILVKIVDNTPVLINVEAKETDGKAFFSWADIGSEVLYRLSIYKDIDKRYLYKQSEWLDKNQYELLFEKAGTYYFNLETYNKSHYSDLTELKINISEQIEEEKQNSPNIESSIEKKDSTEPIKIEIAQEKQMDQTNLNAIGSTPEVLGAQIEKQIPTCTYGISPKGEIYKKKCELPKIQINTVRLFKQDYTNWLEIEYNQREDIRLIIEIEECEKPSLSNIWSFFVCNVQVKERHSKLIKNDGDIWGILDQNKYQPGYDKYEEGKNPKILLPLDSANKYSNVQLKYELSYFEKLGDMKWLDIWVHSLPSDVAPLPPNEITKEGNLYKFPLSVLPGVTQWYGQTAYQSPHTGIDFDATNLPVFATSEGTILTAKWDDYSGKCLSGGNYVHILHLDGKSSVYLHLENYERKPGISWKAGEKIRKGQRIGISGNSGTYNCEPLSNHLHFEIRNGKAVNMHTNPVPLVNVDWSLIRTVGLQTNPGRLSGENPHPYY